MSRLAMALRATRWPACERHDVRAVARLLASLPDWLPAPGRGEPARRTVAFRQFRSPKCDPSERIEVGRQSRTKGETHPSNRYPADVARTTRTLNPLHFEDLEPHRFEDLVRQLAYGYTRWRSLEATGRLGKHVYVMASLLTRRRSSMSYLRITSTSRGSQAATPSRLPRVSRTL